jgi:hypothetical protein
MDQPHFSRELLQQTAEGDSLSLGKGIVSIELEVACPVSAVSLSGSRLKFTLRTSKESIDRFATLGGLILC